MSTIKTPKWRQSSPFGWPYHILHFVYFNTLRVATIGLFFFVVLYALYLSELKEVTPLSDYQSATITKIYSQEGNEVARLARENRLYVPYEDIPEDLISAFISAEDKRFFEHGGVDPISVVRAVMQNISSTNGRRIGASTITQQLAKVTHSGINSKRNIDAKIKEALLALDIERKLSKEQIIELYLNEIPFGLGTFGIASASLRYFGKDLSELGVSEMAFLASLPKSPTNYNPVRHNAKATERRDWVIGRMLANGLLEKSDAWGAMKEPLPADVFRGIDRQAGNYFTDQVRRELMNYFGEKMVFEQGLTVQTTMDAQIQKITKQALRDGLEAYDQRHGWRGNIGNLDLEDATWLRNLEEVKRPKGIGKWKVAVVTQALTNSLQIRVQGGASGIIPLQSLEWARKWRRGQKIGPAVQSAWEVAKPGDLILVQETESTDDNSRFYDLKQVPDVNGGVVVIDPRNGHVLALQGGYDFELSQFNRVSQAKRQPGSTFKPFVFLAALNDGYSAKSSIPDEPMKIALSSGKIWEPKNSDGSFWGKVSLDVALQRSRNLPTVRLARDVGMPKIISYADQFGISNDMPNVLANSLGSWETSLLSVAGAYAMLAQDGELVIPTTIRTIKDRERRTVFDSKTGLCSACLPNSSLIQRTASSLEQSQPLYTKQNVRDLRNILKGVFKQGTGVRLAKGLPSNIAGKTGTTNNNNDAWFAGFTDELVVAVYIGFDTPKTLGKDEQGANVAGPIFKQAFANTLQELQSRDPEYLMPVAKAEPVQVKKKTVSKKKKRVKKKKNAVVSQSQAQQLFGFDVTPTRPYQQPTYSQPIYQQPAYQQPTYRQPVYQQPVYQQPTYQQPTYQQPAYQQPTYQQPVYQGGGTVNSGGIY
ncbi:MAG: PBP1A family penicillin-binding protein [Alphaproteobacteria bacterium]